MRKTLLVLVLALCSACTARPVAPPDDGHPTPGVPSNTTQDSGARFYWTEAEGFAGTGKGVEVLGSGVVHGWNIGDDPSQRPPDFTGSVSVAAAADLFARVAAVDLAALPHGADTAECGVSGLVLACASCTERDLDYDTADQVTPEMNEVWSWFANEPSLVAYSPARYCAF
jgi:hypothetical protein